MNFVKTKATNINSDGSCNGIDSGFIEPSGACTIFCRRTAIKINHAGVISQAGAGDHYSILITRPVTRAGNVPGLRVDFESKIQLINFLTDALNAIK